MNDNYQKYLKVSRHHEKIVRSVIALSYILGIISFSYGAVIVYRTYQLVKERVIGIIMLSVITLLASNAVYMAGTVLLIVTLIDSTTYAAVSMLGGILLLGGLLIFLATYILSGNYLDIAPVPVHVMLFYNSQGLLVYSRKVHYPGIQPLDFTKTLITGAFAAISAILHQTLGKKAKIGFIDAGAYQIYFSQAQKGLGTLAVIATGGNYLLQRSLENFVRSIPLELLEEINTVLHWNRTLVGKFDFILKMTFPYLRVREEENQSYYK